MSFFWCKKTKNHFCSEEIDVWKFPYAVSLPFKSIFHLLSVAGAMATDQMAVHLPGEMLNLAAKAADRARIWVNSSITMQHTHVD
jgi:hypothetical protein